MFRPSHSDAALAWVALAIASWLTCRISSPSRRRAANAALFFLGAAATRYSFQDTPSRWQIVGFSLVAALFAVVGMRFSRRTGGAFEDWVVGTAGAVAGVVLVKFLLEGTVL